MSHYENSAKVHVHCRYRLWRHILKLTQLGMDVAPRGDVRAWSFVKSPVVNIEVHDERAVASPEFK